MSGATTHDLDLPRPSASEAPKLLLLFSGTTILKKPFGVPLEPGSTVLGRGAEHLHPILGDDNRMSREHSVIQYEKKSGQARITDTKSRNGTFVNGAQISQAVLRDGDVCRLGNSLFLFRIEREPRQDGPVGNLIGCSATMARLRHSLSRVAPSLASILLLGQTGTGKEVAARYIHDLSRRGRPFVAVNCTAVPESLAESQLFGHTKGAFTGASEHLGFFRAAQGGTLLLDEIGDLSAQIQPKLLRVLEERMIFPVGSVVGQPLDVRLIFSTNRNLRDAVLAGTFRPDLYSRLAEVIIEMPPLKDRREDILMLLRHGSTTEPSLNLPASLAEVMLLHSWPFNVRELVKLASELSATGDASAIEARLRSYSNGPAAAPAPDVDENDPKRQQLVELLRTHKGNVAAIARILNCPRKYVYRWMEQYSLDIDSFRA